MLDFQVERGPNLGKLAMVFFGWCLSLDGYLPARVGPVEKRP